MFVELFFPLLFVLHHCGGIDTKLAEAAETQKSTGQAFSLAFSTWTPPFEQDSGEGTYCNTECTPFSRSSIFDQASQALPSCSYNGRLVEVHQVLQSCELDTPSLSTLWWSMGEVLRPIVCGTEETLTTKNQEEARSTESDVGLDLGRRGGIRLLPLQQNVSTVFKKCVYQAADTSQEDPQTRQRTRQAGGRQSTSSSICCSYDATSLEAGENQSQSIYNSCFQCRCREQCRIGPGATGGISRSECNARQCPQGSDQSRSAIYETDRSRYVQSYNHSGQFKTNFAQVAGGQDQASYHLAEAPQNDHGIAFSTDGCLRRTARRLHCPHCNHPERYPDHKEGHSETQHPSCAGRPARNTSGGRCRTGCECGDGPRGGHIKERSQRASAELSQGQQQRAYRDQVRRGRRSNGTYRQTSSIKRSTCNSRWGYAWICWQVIFGSGCSSPFEIERRLPERYSPSIAGFEADAYDDIVLQPMHCAACLPLQQGLRSSSSTTPHMTSSHCEHRGDSQLQDCDHGLPFLWQSGTLSDPLCSGQATHGRLVEALTVQSPRSP